MRSSLAQCVAWTLVLFALIDIGLRIGQIGLEQGLYATAHDPGKVFFGVILLPIAARMLISRCPTEVLMQVWSGYRWYFFIGSILFIVGLSATLTVATTVNGFCDRPPVPEDVSDADFQKTLLQTQKLGHDHLRYQLHDTWDLDKIKSVSNNADRAYITLISQERMKHECDFWAQSSLRAKWSGFLNFPAIALALCLIEVLALHTFLGKPFERPVWDNFCIVIGAFLVWQPLRAYSEWWIHFGSKFVLSEMFVAGVAACLAIILLFTTRDSGDTALRMARLIGSGSAITTIAGFIKPEWFQVAAGAFFQLSSLEIALVYLCAFLAVALLARYISISNIEPDAPI